jgi:hypothetical protein
VAVFNLAETPLTVKSLWADLGLGAAPVAARELWTGRRLPRSRTARFTVPPHGVALYRVSGSAADR